MLKKVLSNLEKQIKNRKILNQRYKDITEDLEQRQLNIGNNIDSLSKAYASMQSNLEESKKNFEQLASAAKLQLDKELFEYEEAYKNDLNQDINDIMKTYNLKCASLDKQIKVYESKIEAFIEQQKREEELNNDIAYHSMELLEAEKEDVIKLLALANSLYNSDVLKKLVYKTYFEAKLNDLLGRVVGRDSAVSGIYRITNQVTKKSYIGQCVSFKDRWRTHVKRGLGIEAISSNSLLYKAMQKDKLWNFTFEVLEKCSKEELNSREKYWIDVCQTNTYGYNMKAGG